tara:strand:+ start:484 stop:879 length:396 start_codon:yes stop_codon:yes gene_type:complete
MTEEILQAAILRLRSKATERFAIIKDLYHRPSTVETVDLIVQHSLALAQLEGAMVTLQQYSGALAKQTENEAQSNTPEEEVVEEIEEAEVEEETSEKEDDSKRIGHDELMKRSVTYRKSQKHKKRKNKDES